jgi:hypothetical protein
VYLGLNEKKKKKKRELERRCDAVWCPWSEETNPPPQPSQKTKPKESTIPFSRASAQSHAAQGLTVPNAVVVRKEKKLHVGRSWKSVCDGRISVVTNHPSSHLPIFNVDNRKEKVKTP